MTRQRKVDDLTVLLTFSNGHPWTIVHTITPSRTPSRPSRKRGRPRSPAHPTELEAELEQLRETLQAQSARLDEVLRAYSRLQRRTRMTSGVAPNARRSGSSRSSEGTSGWRSWTPWTSSTLTLQTIPSQTACRDCQRVGNGVRMIRDGLLRHIEQAGVARLPAVGTPFDPQRHEAVELVAVDDPALDGQVVTEIRAGYQQGERVLEGLPGSRWAG